MGALMRAYDFSSSPLGPAEGWPQSLRSVVGLMLGSKFPMFVAWGDEHVFLYNDAYAEVLGTKHPGALGSRLRDVWSEIWPDISPLVDAAMVGEPSYRDNLPLLMNRRGFDEHTWFTFSYSPVRDEGGVVVGMFCAAAETTAQVLAERRQSFRVELGDALRPLSDPTEITAEATRILSECLDCSRVHYAEMEPDGEHAIVPSDHVRSVPNRAGRYRLADFFSLIAQCRTGRPFVVDDISADVSLTASEKAMFAGLPVAAVAVAPLIKDGQLAAILAVHHSESHAWTSEEVALVQETADRIWDAVERVRAEAALRQSEARLRFLGELDETLRNAPDAPTAMRSAAELLGRRLEASRCAYADVDADGGNDRFVIRDDFTAAGVTTSAGTYSLDLFGPRAAADMHGGRTLVISDMAGELALGEGREMFLSIGIGAIVCCPLVKAGRLVAMMAVHQDQARDWRHDEIALIEAVVERCWAHVQRVGAEARLRESEARFRLMVDAVPQIVWITDATGLMEFYNRQFSLYTGAPFSPFQPAEMAANFIHPDDGPAVMSAFAIARANGEPLQIEHRIRSVGGEYRWFQVRAEPFVDEVTGNIVRWFGASVDIHDRKLAESLQIAQNAMLEAAVREAPLGELLESMLRTVEDQSSAGMLGSILLADADGIHLRHGAAPNLPDAYNQAVDGIAIASGVGSCGTAASTRAPVYVTDIAVDPLWNDFRDLALEHGLRACWSTPIISANGILQGTFAMYYREPRTPTPADLDLVGFVTRSASLVIERKTAEKQLKGSEAKYRQIVEGAEDFAIVSIDEHGVVTSWNTGAERITGFAEEEAIGQSGALFFTPADRAAGEPDHELNRAKSDGRSLNERWHQRKDGSLFWGSGLSMRLDTPEGGYLKIFRDRTAEHEAEAELRKMNETLEQRVEARTAERNRVWSMSRDLFAIIGLDGFLKALNPAWEATLGYDEAALMGDPFTDKVHSEDREDVMLAMERLRAGTSIDRFEVRLPHAEGGWRWTAWSLVPEGEVFYAVGRDISAEKIAAEELERAQDALRQSQKMEAMGQLTGGVAHDFNNLLTPIIGSLDLLQRKGLGGEREQRLIAGAAQSAERAKVLVQRLLAFARRQPLQPIPVDVAKLVDGIGDLVASTTGPQIKVVVETTAGLPAAKADPNQLEMALLNLAVNARDAMPEGGTLRISATSKNVSAGHSSRLRAGDYILLSVADTGTGMDELTLARAIEPFFSTKGVGKGTGLGLSMVHGLASQLGGALTIQSRPGLGTNIELWLPRSEHAVNAPEVEQTLSNSAPLSGTALLVDDEQLVRISTADMLSDLGYAVVEATSGEEAMRLVNEGTAFDLIVTDHLMPGMSGTELAAAARALRPGLPVLLVSGYAAHEGLDPNLPRLTKPFRKSDLAASLSRIVAPT